VRRTKFDTDLKHFPLMRLLMGHRPAHRELGTQDEDGEAVATGLQTIADDRRNVGVAVHVDGTSY